MLGFAFITKLLKYGGLPSLWSLLLPNPKLISQRTILGLKKPNFGTKIQKLKLDFLTKLTF